jgi:serine/threonine protein kinase
MAIVPGARVGAFEVLGSLGAGGMGEVYRARDTRLHRDVALKVLPALLSQDPDRLARFEREATVLAALNHPNIAAVYGVAESVNAIVMELVEGETLASGSRADHCPSTKPSQSRGRSPMRSMRRTSAASFIVI